MEATLNEKNELKKEIVQASEPKIDEERKAKQTDALKKLVDESDFPVKYKNLRKIEPAPSDSKSKKAENITVLSYNILADCYSYSKQTGVSWIKYCDDKFLNFKYRSRLILKQFEEFDCDIMCLQEVDEHGFYLPELKALGYDMVFIKKVERNDASLIAWKSKKFEFVKKIELFLAERLNEEKLYSNHDYLRPDVGIIAELRSVETGMIYVVATSHLFWNPNYECVQYFQALQLMRKLEENFPAKTAKIIWGGDFNTLPKSNVISMIRGDDNLKLNTHLISEQQKKDFIFLKSKYLSEGDLIKRRYTSAYQNFRNDGNELRHQKYTNFTPDFVDCIDYIFYNPESGLSPLVLQDFPNEEELLKEGCCPNRFYPSDHLPLIVEFLSWEL